MSQDLSVILIDGETTKPVLLSFLVMSSKLFFLCLWQRKAKKGRNAWLLPERVEL